MLLAMISVLTLLPKLILTFKPLEKKLRSFMIVDFFENLLNKINLFDIFFF